MARFRKRARRAFRSVARSYRRARAPSLSPMDVVIAGAIYGAARPMIASKLPTMFNFNGVDSDNLILGVAGFFASKQKSKLLKSLGLIAMGTEAGIVSANVITQRGATATSNDMLY